MAGAAALSRDEFFKFYIKDGSTFINHKNTNNIVKNVWICLGKAMGYEVLDSMGCGMRFPASQHGNLKSPMGYCGGWGIRGMG